MRILYLDCDSLRPDHLGCYGYHRDTSPNIDALARRSAVFDKCYVPDAPCLPSRTALITGRPGILNGVVNHGGAAALPFRDGTHLQFCQQRARWTFFEALRNSGWHTAAITPFPARHSAWHFCAGLKEFHDTGHHGNEIAPEILGHVEPWLQTNGQRDNWFLYVNLWDAHRPYRTPAEYGEPFADDPPPGWMTQEILDRHWQGTGMQCAQDPNDATAESNWPRMPRQIRTLADYKRWIDGYDTAIRYLDEHIGRIFATLERLGIADDTAVILSADHGENQGELNHYGSHRTGDQVTHHVPLIFSWPGRDFGGRRFRGLHYQFDWTATVLDLLGIERPADWLGRSFSDSLLSGAEDIGREYLVLSQLACMAQRSVRFGQWLYAKTWHDGFAGFPAEMLFDIEADPHELEDRAQSRPDIVLQGRQYLREWQESMRSLQSAGDMGDPLDTVLKEGPYHAGDQALRYYVARLRATGRADAADHLERNRGYVVQPDTPGTSRTE